MMKVTVAILIALALVLAACTKTNPDQKPVYYVPPTDSAA
jgi:hypothetical protein